MISTDKVKEMLKKFGPQTVVEIAKQLADSTGESCDTFDVEEALDKLRMANEIVQQGRVYNIV